jgi:hypothetical protein
MVTTLLPFRLKVPGVDEVRDFKAISRSYRFRGQLQVREQGLCIEWGGTARVQEADTIDVRDDQIHLPDESLDVPFTSLYRAQVLGGWWRPRLELQARELAALAIVPSSEAGLVRFWIAHRDRAVARQVAEQINAGVATAALRTPDSWPELQPPTR